MIPFDLCTTVDDVSTAMAIRAEQAGLELVSFVSPAIPPLVVGDPGKVRQVLNNLIGNAVKFTHQGGIWVEAGVAEDLGSRVRVRFLVRDTRHRHPQGETSDDLRELHPSRQLHHPPVRRHRPGNEHLQETRGNDGRPHRRGKPARPREHVLVRPDLPRASRPGTRRARGDVALEGLRVLVVDDNKDHRFIASQYLKSWGCRPVEAAGSEDALAILQAAVRSRQPFAR